ncbi:MAG: hypothetical protein KBS58_01150 [Bacteroidales bacterium]|nr:hypothetical protein [Candidatus Cacconaster equi]
MERNRENTKRRIKEARESSATMPNGWEWIKIPWESLAYCSQTHWFIRPYG